MDPGTSRGDRPGDGRAIAQDVRGDLFDSDRAAELYARARPYHHDLVIQRIEAQLDIHDRLDRALDVACGTGLSCTGLKRIAQHVVGADVSRAMLGQVRRDERIDYMVSTAETLPLLHESCDLLTVSSALHWFERNAFLAEARRVLRPRSWLVIYDNFFSANLHGNPGFKLWFASGYLERFPTPPRDNRPLDRQSAEQAGFLLLAQEKYANVVIFDCKQLINYLLTQTNVIEAVERGASTPNDSRAYLISELSPFFASSERHAFDFGGPIIYLRKAN